MIYTASLQKNTKSNAKSNVLTQYFLKVGRVYKNYTQVKVQVQVIMEIITQLKVIILIFTWVRVKSIQLKNFSSTVVFMSNLTSYFSQSQYYNTIDYYQSNFFPNINKSHLYTKRCNSSCIWHGIYVYLHRLFNVAHVHSSQQKRLTAASVSAVILVRSSVV